MIQHVHKKQKDCGSELLHHNWKWNGTNEGKGQQKEKKGLGLIQ